MSTRQRGRINGDVHPFARDGHVASRYKPGAHFFELLVNLTILPNTVLFGKAPTHSVS